MRRFLADLAYAVNAGLVEPARSHVRRALGIRVNRRPCGTVETAYTPCLCPVCHDRLAEVVFDELDDGESYGELIDQGVIVLDLRTPTVHVVANATHSLRRAA